MTTSDRFSRQQDIVPAERLGSCAISIIGVGAIGRQVALQLAAMGAPHLQLIDFDVVEESNLASQGYLEEDLGRRKVEATAAMCRRINSQLQVPTVNERFRRSMDVGDVVLVCVDKIETRRLIWEAVKDRARFFGDARMSAEVVRVLAAADSAGRGHYPTTLFVAEQAYAGSCTAKSTIYTANIAAGLLIGQFTRHLRGLPVDPDITLNILTAELTCG
jgi:sulfur carrier protein ThiS adenylyltransferase